MKEREIVEMVDILTEEFKIPKPKVKITNASRGTYFVTEHLIKVGMKSNFGPEDLTLHEFAHALTDTIHGKIKRGRKTSWHGPQFVQSLIEIVQAWYGDQEKYCWQKEYRSLRAYGPPNIKEREEKKNE